MITKNDCFEIIIKSNIENKKQLILELSPLPLIEVIRKVNELRLLDVTNFYKKLRKSYNQKRSKLYKDLVREIDDPNKAAIILTIYLQNAMLYKSEVNGEELFRKSARVPEVLQVLINFFNYDIIKTVDMLKTIRNDIKCLELFEKELNIDDQ